MSHEGSQMREENERLRKDHSRGAEQQARIVASLRSEVRFLREELARRVTPAPAKSPTVVPFEAPVISSTSDNPSPSDTPRDTETSPVCPAPPARQSPSELRADDPVRPPLTTIATVSEKKPKKGNRPAFLGAMELCALSVVERPPRQRALFVSKLSPDTATADLKKHIESQNICPLSCRRLKTKYSSYSSFYVTVDEENMQRLNDPSMWPRGCIFKPFRGILHDNMLHPSESVIDSEGV